MATVFQCLRRCNYTFTALNGLRKVCQGGGNIWSKKNQATKLAPQVNSVLQNICSKLCADAQACARLCDVKFFRLERFKSLTTVAISGDRDGDDRQPCSKQTTIASLKPNIDVCCLKWFRYRCPKDACGCRRNAEPRLDSKERTGSLPGSQGWEIATTA